MTVSAIIFDLDDTLIVEQDYAMASLREALSVFPDVVPVEVQDIALEAIRQVWRQGEDHPLCHQVGIASWEGLWATFEGNHPSLDGLLKWASTYRDEAWSAVAERLNVSDARLPGAASERFQQAQRRGHPVVDGASATLELLAPHYRMGLLTNGPSDLQRLKVAQAGLSARFDAVVISGEVAVGKPNEAVFAEVLQQLDARPEDSVMVGDSWERDIIGATNAGMAAFWLATGRPTPEVHERVTSIDDIRDLGQLVP
ncbi:MAG: HAD family hydrolase [Acidimicrobiales bacterium]